MQWGIAIVLMAIPFATIAIVWTDRIRSGEYQRLWRPFWRALRTGQSPADVDQSEWSTFLATRRNRTIRVILVQSVMLGFYTIPEWLNKTGFSTFHLAYLSLIVLGILQLIVRLGRIEQLATAATSPV